MILSTAYLGNIRYYTKLLSGEAVIDLHEHYRKQSYRNRCDILTANGVCPLIVPVLHPSGEKVPVRDIRIDRSKKWRHQHWQAIVSAYRRSPYFAYYEEDMAPLYARPYEFLCDLNEEMQRLLLGWLGTEGAAAHSDRYVEGVPEAEDFRSALSPKPRLDRPDPAVVPQPDYQVFSDRFPFRENLSVIDLLFCEGPGAAEVLRASMR